MRAICFGRIRAGDSLAAAPPPSMMSSAQSASALGLSFSVVLAFLKGRGLAVILIGTPGRPRSEMDECKVQDSFSSLSLSLNTFRFTQHQWPMSDVNVHSIRAHVRRTWTIAEHCASRLVIAKLVNHTTKQQPDRRARQQRERKTKITATKNYGGINLSERHLLASFSIASRVWCDDDEDDDVAGTDRLLSADRNEAIRSARALLRVLRAGLPVRLDPRCSMLNETAMPRRTYTRRALDPGERKIAAPRTRFFRNECRQQ